MATLVLQAAGAFLGGVFGPVGSAVGSAIGAMAGYALDRSLIEGTRRIEAPRLGNARPFAAEEGAPIARVYGTVRVGGNLIWATRFEEARKTERQGGKGGGPTVTTYSYFCNAAFALCEGRIAGVRRIWADGRELDLEQLTVRVHLGGENQTADPLIVAKQGSGNAPAYRGTAYAVIERFPIGDYGNRIPQFQFEVMRPVGGLHEKIRSVALLPGSTEYGLSPQPVRRVTTPGRTLHINRNVLHAGSDLIASLDELQALCPNLEEVAVVVTWFGDDLRAGACRIEPRVMDTDPEGYSEAWSVGGVTRPAARLVSSVDGGAAYGGTPSDQSVIDCVAELKARGLRVSFYPFIMMDVPPDNDLPDPYGGDAQPSYPWRGRITCHPAPGLHGSVDKAASARSQVNAFRGSVATGHFAIADSQVVYSGPPNDWGFRRLVLHYAHLAKAAGGVHTFALGSEMRGLTTLRDNTGAFPFVEALCDLASELRAILGSQTAITYAADWSEYFGHQPTDGSGDAIFHLDPLWSHEAITAVGIDNYMPLADWRDKDEAGGNPDGFRFPDDPAGLRSQIAAGEGFDWYYADAGARLLRERTSISDGDYDKPWVFRYKDIRSWWENRHFNRIGGVEQPSSTGWQPRLKPIWFTELGCPAIDKGPNQPNVFTDPKSTENAVPHFSNGGRSDLSQQRFLDAHFDYWTPGSPYFVESNNPVSDVYGGRMVNPSRMSVWAWDARPYPAFPRLRSLWSDGRNWHRGHWLSGRLSTVPVGELIGQVLHDHGFDNARIDAVPGTVAGYLIDAPSTARSALEPIASLFGLGIHDEAGRIAVRAEMNGAAPVEISDMAIEADGAAVERTRQPDHDLPREAELRFVDPGQDYQAALARDALPGPAAGATQTMTFPGCLEAEAASALLADWTQRRWVGRESLTFRLPASGALPRPGDMIGLPPALGGGVYLATALEGGIVCRVSARRIARAAQTSWRSGLLTAEKTPIQIAGAPHALLLDLPMMPGETQPHEQLRVAAWAEPWRPQAVFASPEASGFSNLAMVTSPATVGVLLDPLGMGVAGRFHHASELVVNLYGGELASASKLKLLTGANLCAVRAGNVAWELIQFLSAEEVAPSVWRLGGLLRGQLGTDDAMLVGASEGAAFVLLDSAVIKAGLPAELGGLTLRWRVGPAGQDFGGPDYVEMTANGGARSRLPLSPVHVHARKVGNDFEIGWIRRSRIDGDGWDGEDVPLGEESERYRVAIVDAGVTLRTFDTFEPRTLYLAEQIAADFAVLPAEATIVVRQISASAGAGLPATATISLG